ncbi:hypothetical protein cyc_04631 [Cyclospora cayetanensis]|uniref:Uncharacterized protein n=1 Tax=Cyclospora cayetanensis TaxID=88456 RepID=A0A1D3CTL5_9EIME|nr:hypothetical protein cyc_04631 [Cyclospora cayetanensis]
MRGCSTPSMLPQSDTAAARPMRGWVTLLVPRSLAGKEPWLCAEEESRREVRQTVLLQQQRRLRERQQQEQEEAACCLCSAWCMLRQPPRPPRRAAARAPHTVGRKGAPCSKKF